jgi:hypothetical protein
MRRTPLVVAALGLTVLLTACDPTDAPMHPAAGATCIVGATDCNDMSFGHRATEDDAAGLVGLTEAELPSDVRIARIDDETFPLTEDYRVGRLTVEITDGHVVQVTLEAEDGPVTVR